MNKIKRQNLKIGIQQGLNKVSTNRLEPNDEKVIVYFGQKYF